MKPIHLSLRAFGAFAGAEEIDFEALSPRGLFLVSGGTGTGKTTIFDAMCWALYGTMPLKDAAGVRSDHVDETVRCEVRFTFERGGTRYTVTRNPDQLRPSLRGGGHANETASAHLVRHDEDGTTSIAEKSRTVTAACEELIGLDATQFQRVVLLPQGDFSQFLLAKTDAREAILEKIFGGEIFERITRELKADRDRLEAELGTVEIRGREQLQEATRHLDETERILDSVAEPDPAERPDGTPAALPFDETEASMAETDAGPASDLEATDSDGRDTEEGHTNGSEAEEPEAEALDAEALEERVTAARTRLEALDERVSDADDRRQRTDDRHRAASDAAGRFDRAAEHRRTLAELDRTEAEVRAREAAARRSAAARPVLTAHTALEQAEKGSASARALLGDRHDQLRDLFGSLGDEIPVDEMGPAELSRTLEQHRRSNTERQDLLTSHQDAVTKKAEAEQRVGDLEGEIAEFTAELATKTERKAEIEAELPTHRAAAVDRSVITTAIEATDRLIRLRGQLDSAERDRPTTADRAVTAADTYRSILARFVDTQAPRLAAELVDGEPCPVCGAAEHPHPAVDAGGDEIDFEAVEAAGAAADTARAALGELDGRLDQLRGRLGDDVGTDIEQLRQRRSALEEQHRAADVAHSAVDRLEGETEALDAAISALLQRMAATRAGLEQARTNLVEATSELTDATTRIEGIDPDSVRRDRSIIGRVEEALTGLDRLADAVTTARSTVDERRSVLATLLAESDHDDIDSVRAAVLDEVTERTAVQAAERHDRMRSEADSRLRELTEQGVPEQRPDVDAARAIHERATEDHSLLSERSTRASTRLDAADDALRTHVELLAGTEELRRRTDLARTAHQVCQTGRGDLRVSLKRWVLSRELDRITAMANRHLARMTGSRFALHRVEEQSDRRSSFGLDLEVFDANTGRRRSPSSLSGGEQFQASLALALGLADVISHGGTASGHAFEALFVDEGFGSLSADALDEAVETLMGLQETGRMVGAITHVEAMKESLHVGIEVRHADDRPGSTLTVRP